MTAQLLQEGAVISASYGNYKSSGCRRSNLKDMPFYIYENYNNKVTLNDIATAGAANSSTNLMIFKKDLLLFAERIPGKGVRFSFKEK